MATCEPLLAVLGTGSNVGQGFEHVERPDPGTSSAPGREPNQGSPRGLMETRCLRAPPPRSLS